SWPIYDCRQCFCRFTKHDEPIYDALHSDDGCCYNIYRDLQDRCASAFHGRSLETLKLALVQNPKYRFIIDKVGREPHTARLLEIGCSRGYLTSYFILAGYPVAGVDVSTAAINAARAAFGDHFLLSGDPS